MKGFVYTLEAVIASTLILGMVLFVLPQSFEEPEIDLSPVRTGLETIDQGEGFGNNSSSVNKRLDSYIPPSFNYSVRLTQVNSTNYRVTGDREIYLDRGSKNLLLWIESSQDLNITFRGDYIVQTDEEGFEDISIGSQPGYLNFSADNVELDAKVDRYETEGSLISGDNVYSISYIDVEDQVREIQVVLTQ